MHKALAWILLAVALAGLVVALDADPSRLLWRDFITDEGWWTAEARDRALFGAWVLDGYNQGLAVPVATWTWWGAFELLGPSLLSARLPALIASLLTLLCLMLMLRREGRDSPPLGALLLASALPFALHARVAMPEPLALLGVTAAWWLLTGERRGAPLLAGLACGLALSAKLSVIVALPALLWIARGSAAPFRLPAGGGAVIRMTWLERWSRSVHFGFAALIAHGLLRLPFGLRYLPEISALERLYRGENLPGHPVDLIANLAYFPFPAPFLYQTAPLLALAGIGAWSIGLDWRRRDLAGQALAFLLIAGFCQALFLNPADRRFLVFLPALALLALRGWRALATGESLPTPRFARVGTAAVVAAAFALSAVLPGRLAIWWNRLLHVLGEPLPDTRLRALAAGLFVAGLAAGLLALGRRPGRASAALNTGLLVGWLVILMEPFDFLAWAGLFQLMGKYDAGRLWLEMGGFWALPWGLLTLILIWLPLARCGLLPGGRAAGARPLLPWLVPALALAVLAPSWLRPSFSLREAGTALQRPRPGGEAPTALVGPEAASLGIGTGLKTVVLRGTANRIWQEKPPPGTRRLLLIEDSGERLASEPRGAEILELCPQSDGGPRFRVAVWDP